MLDFLTMERKLQSALSLEKYIHTMGTAQTAVKLAQKYGVDEHKAKIAALLHDCAKNYPNDMKLRLCKEYHVPLEDCMLESLDLAHPFLGAEVARREYKVEDEEILNAVRYHTTGRKNMTTLEKIVFIADYIEPNRKPFDTLEEARKLANEDLDTTMAFILKDTIKHIKKKKRALHPLSVEAYEYYKELVNGR